MENEKTSITTKLLEIQELGLKYEKKSKSHYGKYLNLEDLLDKLIPECNKRKLLITHSGVNGSWSTRVVDTESGEVVESSFPLQPGIEPQKQGANITYAKRYNLASIFNVTADEDTDAHNATIKNDNFNL